MDKVIFKYNGITLNYQVRQNTVANSFYLSCDKKPNCQIFDLLEIQDRFLFCEEKIGYTIVDKSTSFPEVKTLEDLEQIVDALYQRIIDISTPKFKEGKRVRILPKNGLASHYPYSYIPKMEELANTIAIISQVNTMSISNLEQYMPLETYEEPFYYKLNDNVFSWTSVMLESVSIDKDKEEKVLPKFNIGDKVKVKTLDVNHRYDLYLNPNMLAYSNQEFEIEKCYNWGYSLKGIDYWTWSSDMLEKVDNILLPPELPKADINTQTVIFGNIKAVTDTIPFKEEKDSSVDYKLNFTVSILDFKK